MAEQTQYFDFSSAKDPFSGVSAEAVASLMPKAPGQLRIDILKESCTIGRTQESDIVIPHRNVSKNHASLKKDGSMWELADIGSTNGTFVNGQKVSSPVLISHHDTVSFGDQAYEFVIHEERERESAGGGAAAAPSTGAQPAAAAPGGGMTAMFGSLFQSSGQQGGGGAAAAPPQPAADGGMPQMGASLADAPSSGENRTVLRSYDFAEAAEQSKVFATLIEKSLSSRQFNLTSLRSRIGSAVTNEVRIEDTSIDNEHAELTFERDGRIKIRVLNNALIIKVNGEPVKMQYLRDLDTVQLGDIVYTLKIQHMPDLADFEKQQGEHRGGKGGLLVAAVIVIVLAVAGIFVVPGMLGGSTPLTGSATPTPTPNLQTQTKDDYDVALALFQKEALVEARDLVVTLNASDQKVADLKDAVMIMIQTEAFLNSDDVVGASREIVKIAGNPHEEEAFVTKLRKRVDFEQRKKADEAYARAEREYKNQRYADAKRFFERAQQMLPGYKDAADQMEAADLADKAVRAIQEGEAAIVRREYAKAQEVLETMLAQMEAKSSISTTDNVIKEFKPHIEDLYNLAMMRGLYREGKAQQAYTHYQKISEKLRAQERLDPLAERMMKVADLTEQAVRENSLAKASEVLQFEQDSENYYFKIAKELVDTLAAAQRGEAEQHYQRGEELMREEDYARALEAYWKSRQLDPTSEDARKRHDDAADSLLVRAYRLPHTQRDQKVEIYNWVISNSDPADRVYKVAERQLNGLQP